MIVRTKKTTANTNYSFNTHTEIKSMGKKDFIHVMHYRLLLRP